MPTIPDTNPFRWLDWKLSSRVKKGKTLEQFKLEMALISQIRHENFLTIEEMDAELNKFECKWPMSIKRYERKVPFQPVKEIDTRPDKDFPVYQEARLAPALPEPYKHYSPDKPKSVKYPRPIGPKNIPDWVRPLVESEFSMCERYEEILEYTLRFVHVTDCGHPHGGLWKDLLNILKTDFLRKAVFCCECCSMKIAIFEPAFSNPKPVFETYGWKVQEVSPGVYRTCCQLHRELL